MAHLLRECLSDGSGHWEPAPSKPAPYTLARPPKLSHYAPQACDKPGQPSTRSVLRHSWVPTGPRCAALRQQHAPWLNTTLETLAARFCKRHNGSKILLVGDSIMSQWFLGLAASLGAPAFSSATTRACGSSGGALDYDVGQTAVACKGGGVRLRYVRNGVLDVNATAEAAGRASQGGCVPDPSSTNQPWVYLAAQSDFVVLNRGVWVEQDDQVFVAQVNRTLRALRLRRSRAHGDAGPAAAVGSRGRAGPAERGGASAAASGAAATGRPLSPDAGPPRVVWRGTPASIPRCWRLPDPLPAPFSFNFSANPLLTSERGVSLFSWHRFAPQNVLARRLVEAAGHAYLDTYQQTAQRPGGHHPSRHDCVHWCLPGPPDEWTRLLLLLWMHGAHPSNGKVDYQLT